MQPKNPIRVYHVGDKTGESGLGVMTVATEVLGSSDLKMAFAFCSPKDRFNAKEGKRIALERLANTPGKNITSWTGNSARDVKDFWNAYMDEKDKPQLWKHRILVNIPQAHSLAFVDKAKVRPIRPKKYTRNDVIVYVEGGVCMGAQASSPSAIALKIFDVDNLKEEGLTQDEICNIWNKITKNTHPIF